jgi:SSS family solute:Na+ symporter
VAISDTINGLGLLIGGTLVTVLAFLKLGEGSFSRACRILTEQRPDLLNAIGGEKSAVPFSSLFTALLLISVSYWGLNQFIIQRTFGARSLAEGQKGVLFAGLLKILGVGIVVFPGILAYHLFNGGLPHGDLAYPRLVKDVLPSPLMGFFSAVLFGAIITTFDSALHSLSTVLSVDIYKPLLRRQASDSEVVWAGKIVGIILIAFSVGIVPLISGSSEGVFNLMKRIGGYTAGPTTAITLMAFLHRRNPPWSAYIALPVGMIFYGLFTDVRGGLLCRWNGADVRLHWLHWYALSFFVVFALMLLVRWICPPATETEGVARPPPPGVDLRPWRYARPAALGLLAAVVLVYWFFSPLGVAR